MIAGNRKGAWFTQGGAVDPNAAVWFPDVVFIPDRACGQTFALSVSPGYVNADYAAMAHMTNRIELGWGTGNYYSTYPGEDGCLYTGPRGTGTKINTAWAASAPIFVDALVDQETGELITAADPSQRVLLDVSVENSPRYAGLNAGVQDSHQHPTARCYPVRVRLKPAANPLSVIIAHEFSTQNDDVCLVQSDAGSWQMSGNPPRHYPSWGSMPVHSYATALGPHVDAVWSIDDGRGEAIEYSQLAGSGGVFTEGFVAASTSADSVINLFGPASSLRGWCYAIMIATGPLDPAAMKFEGIPAALANLFTPRMDPAKPSIVYPRANQVIAMDTATQTGAITIRGFGKPGTEYEARWGGSWFAIGQPDARGVINARLTNQAAGNHTLEVRQAGASAAVCINSVAIGYVLAIYGESNADGRGDDVTVTIPQGYLRKGGLDWTAPSKEWAKLFCQRVYDHFGCVVGVTKCALGSTLFVNGNHEGNWSIHPAASEVACSADGRIKARTSQLDYEAPNAWIWDLGVNDASQNTSAAVFENRFMALLANYRLTLDNPHLTFANIISGPDPQVNASWLAAIRDAQRDLWTRSGFRPAGDMSGINYDGGDGHVVSQVQKQKVADAAYAALIG